MKLISRILSQLLIVSMIMLPFSARAGMVGTDQAVASAQDMANRAKVVSFVTRGDVVKQFQALGVDSSTAQDRVNAMTQDEINHVAGKIDSLPVGASDGWAWAAAVVIVALVIYFVWYKA